MTEAELQTSILELARWLRWRCYHTHDSRRSAAGFPDLVLVRERVIYAELKAAAGRVSPEQTEWLELLREAGEEIYVWRPDDWTTGKIETVLRFRASGRA